MKSKYRWMVKAMLGLAFSLNSGAQIRVIGTVSDSTGLPVSDAFVEFIDESDTTRNFHGLTDAYGKYSILFQAAGFRPHPEILPGSCFLFQNYPNPFNPSTWITYEIVRPSFVRVEVADILGRKVKSLVCQFQQSGVWRTVWDATDQTGRGVPAGLYLCRLSTNTDIRTRKMVLMDGSLGQNPCPGPPIPEPVGNRAVPKPDGSLFTIRVSGSEVESLSVLHCVVDRDMAIDLKVARVPDCDFVFTVLDSAGGEYERLLRSMDASQASQRLVDWLLQ